MISGWGHRFLSGTEVNQVGKEDGLTALGPELPCPLLPLLFFFPQLALRNALRYFPPDVQELLAPEFAQELRLYGHIYMYRFCPTMKMRSVLETGAASKGAQSRKCVGGTALEVSRLGESRLSTLGGTQPW